MKPVELVVPSCLLHNVADKATTPHEVLRHAHVKPCTFLAALNLVCIILGNVDNITVCSAHSSLQSE